MAEAAAILDADEDAIRLLQESDEEEPDQELSRRAQLYLAVAEANTGRPTARRRLEMLQETFWAGQILEALNTGKRGLGWTERFPYFHFSELVPKREIERLIQLFTRREQLPAAQFRREVARFAERFPQLVLAGKKLLLEEQQTEAAMTWLTILGTVEAHAVLREFGIGQAGDEETRMRALFALAEAGQLAKDETVRFWQQGEWQEIQIKNTR